MYAAEARGWWIRELVGSMLTLEVHTRFDLEVDLKHVAWVEGYFNEILQEADEEEVETGEIDRICGDCRHGCAGWSI